MRRGAPKPVAHAEGESWKARKAGLCVVGAVSLFAASCLPEAVELGGPSAAQVQPGGPLLEIRLGEAAVAALVAEGEVEVLDAPGGETLHCGALPVDVDGRCLVTRRDDSLELGGRPCPARIHVRSVSRDRPAWLALERDGQDAPFRVRGALIFAIDKGLIRVANQLTLEEYLAGVIGAEMAASVVPLEALKAQAVAARSYALNAMERAAAQGRQASFAGDSSFQAYGGLDREHPRVLAAVVATRAEVLQYQGRVLRAYFHSTCGGRTSPASLVFQEPSVPPLEGAGCGACSEGRFAVWATRFERADLEAALQSWAAGQGMAMGALSSLEVRERTPDGRALGVRVVHTGGQFLLEASRLRTLVGLRPETPLRSTAFEIASDGDAFVISGRGWGHGVGLCQVGAARRAATQSYREVLAAYFPGSELVRAY